ncbi:serine/threonine-protein phosphatase 2A activator-like [Cyclospora cayetanensis]|uniref:Serine/threonine-protein phosphatase 2A activator n=1 Tax=Cyclospora cayetanensis TaxID=88456 RepID=A0A6P6RUV7_9EIME|nr:serine/threonine-protein phosphatase 2A activator-like [Cyclospora cayetanensis]
MQPHDKASPFDWRGLSALHGERVGNVGGRFEGHHGRPPPMPDAFCCVHPSALENRQQQAGGDWHLRATSKQVRTDADLRRWLSSPIHSRFLAFIGRLANRAAGKKSMPSLLRVNIANQRMLEAEQLQLAQRESQTTAAAAGPVEATARAQQDKGFQSLIASFAPFTELPSNAACWELLGVLRQLLQWSDDIEPVQQPTRFGNQAFKTWCRKVEDEAGALLINVWEASGVDISDDEKQQLTEMFCSSFGNPVRLDFGTGHECAFAIFLFCLFEKKILKPEEHDPFAVLGIFKGYVEVAHALQQRYMLEAAGSRGVWGLDDFHFLTFLWGAGQLAEQQIIEPAQITERDLVRHLAADLLYFDSIEYVMQTKKGAPFFECSPILYDVSGISSW